MPEGPEIRRAADLVSDALLNKPITKVELILAKLKRYQKVLADARVTAVDTHGKAMLTRFNNGLTLYSHNQLYGRWYIQESHQYPDTKRKLRVAIHTTKTSAQLYSASEIEILSSDELSRHPFLSKLGPDVLATTDVSTFINQLTEARFYRRQLGSTLTEQSMVAGLGNYLRCEVLFAAGLHPTSRPVDCSDEKLEQLATLILGLAKQSYKTGGITADLSRANKLIANGATFEDARFNVFRREHLPCYSCGTLIEKYYAGSQACYVCPQCQIGIEKSKQKKVR